MNRYPVQWGDRTLYLTDQLVGVKQGFCEWLLLKLRSDAERDYAGYPAKLNAYLDGLRARVWWVADRMSPTVWEWLYKSHEGGRQYARLLFGGLKATGRPDDPNVMSDAELDRLLDAKEADPSSDYMVALAKIQEEANPPNSTARPESGSVPTGT